MGDFCKEGRLRGAWPYGIHSVIGIVSDRVWVLWYKNIFACLCAIYAGAIAMNEQLLLFGVFLYCLCHYRGGNNSEGEYDRNWSPILSLETNLASASIMEFHSLLQEYFNHFLFNLSLHWYLPKALEFSSAEIESRQYIPLSVGNPVTGGELLLTWAMPLLMLHVLSGKIVPFALPRLLQQPHPPAQRSSIWTHSASSILRRSHITCLTLGNALVI